jgi:peptide/nickel transport system permease protein
MDAANKPDETGARDGARGTFAHLADSDLVHSFLRSKIVVLAALVTLVMIGAAALAPWIAPHNPYDLTTLSLLDAHNPPAWSQGGDRRYLLGTDDQGRDLLSTMLLGTRASLTIGLLATLLALVIGVSLGLVAGYFGGRVDMVIMRVADVQLTFPAILSALVVDGVARIVFRTHGSGGAEFWILALSIGLSLWVPYARTVRSSALVERNKEYVQAARLIGLSRGSIMFRHVLPNVTGPVLVIATINIATAILLEATLSFLGIGLPPTQPSLGTLINIGNRFLFSGEWWIVIFPGVTLAALILAVNLLGDWLRDALNPKLR